MSVKRWLAMGPEELRRRRRKLKLTQAQFGRAIGLVSAKGDGRTVREWELGNRRIPGTVKILIALMAASPEVREELIAAPETKQKAESQIEDVRRSLQAQLDAKD